MRADYERLDAAERERVCARLMRQREVDVATGCWLWTGYVGESGYGVTRVLGRAGWLERVHRLAMIVLRHEVVEGRLVCHRCDVRRCFNPDHLFVGTAQDNTRDMFEKGRWVRPRVHRGAESTSAKLCESDVCDMLAMSRAGNSRADIARKYGVSISLVSKIVLGRMWRHVTAGAEVARSTRGRRAS